MRHQAAFFVTVLIDAGVSTDRIAKQFGFSRKYVNELARDMAKAVAALRDPARHEFRIECGPAVPDGPTEPYDPATVTGLVWMAGTAQATGGTGDPDYWKLSDAIAQESGYGSLVEMHQAQADPSRAKR
jgi:hypothetical protein